MAVVMILSATGRTNTIERLVATKTKAIEKREGQLKSKNRELEAFCSRVAHDLRGTVSNVQGIAEIIQGSKNMAEVREMTDILKDTTKQASRIIDGLYELSSVMHTDRQFEWVEISAVIKEAIQANEPKFKDVDITIDCPHSILCAHKVMPQVFQNLIDNSIRHAERGAAIKIHINSSANKIGTTDIYYEDNGPGIPSDAAEHIFEPFKTFESASARGLGLGLHIVKTIIDIHNGSITLITSRVLTGVAFKITLPTSI